MVFTSNTGNIKLSDQWISADTASINASLQNMSNPIQDYTSIFSLYKTGIEFIQNNGDKGEIICISNSDNLNGYWNSVNLAFDVWDLVDGSEIIINSVQFLPHGPNAPYTNYSIRYFHNRLASISGGFDYNNYGGGNSVWIMIDEMLQELTKESYIFDFHTSLADGFTAQNYGFNSSGVDFHIKKPIIQVGQYFGNFPFELEFSSFVDGNVISDNLSIPSSEIITSDTLLREMWFDHFIKELEEQADGYSDILNIIDLSIDERVLSSYTAFLALDLQNGGEPCMDCWENGGGQTSIEELEENEIGITIKIAPNPFSDFVVVNLDLDDDLDIDEAQLTIFDIYGKKIISRDVSDLGNIGNIQWTWNGTDANGKPLPSGVYFLVLQTDKGSKTVKLNLIR